ncbi:hypothetical protein GCM10023310_62740 [Paenibacillus vulneris]
MFAASPIGWTIPRFSADKANPKPRRTPTLPLCDTLLELPTKVNKARHPCYNCKVVQPEI